MKRLILGLSILAVAFCSGFGFETYGGATVDAALGTPSFTALNLPSSNADPGTTAGQIRHDSTVTNFTRGAIRWWDGTGIRQLIDLAAATAEGCGDGYAITYNATNDNFQCTSIAGAAHDAVTLGATLSSIFSLTGQELGLTAWPTFNQNTTGTAAGLSGTPNITVGTISAGATGFSVDADGDMTAKSINIGRTAGVTSILDLFEIPANGDNKISIKPPDALASDVVITAPGVTSTLAILGANTFTGTQALGANDLTLTGSIAATGSRVTKGWFTDIESTNMPTVGGTALLSSLTAPQFTTIELGHASDTTLARSAAGVVTIEGAAVHTGTSLALSGNLTGLVPPVVLTHASGVHDGSDDAATMTDSGESFTTSSMVGMTVYNITDGSSCTVTANNGTTITCTLAGGTGNDWDTNDVWQVGPGPLQSGSVFYVSLASTIRHPATAGYAAGYYVDGAVVLTIDPASASMVITNATAAAVDAGDSIDSPNTAGSMIYLHNKSATAAMSHGKIGTWTDGGAD